jgi:hypothetical protein
VSLLQKSVTFATALAVSQGLCLTKRTFFKRAFLRGCCEPSVRCKTGVLQQPHILPVFGEGVKGQSRIAANRRFRVCYAACQKLNFWASLNLFPILQCFIMLNIIKSGNIAVMRNKK